MPTRPPPHPLQRLRGAARLTLLTALLLAAASSRGHAFSPLFQRVANESDLSSLFRDYEAHADVQDGFMIGSGIERLHRLPDGRLRIERVRRYTQVRRHDTGEIRKLPEPWEIDADLLVDPALRLISADTRLHFAASGDTVFPGYKLSDEHDWLFKADRSLLRAVDGGRRLELQTFRAGKLIDSKRYDYPAHTAVLEVVALYLCVAVYRHVDQFDFDLLVPGGGVHGVRSQVYHTEDLRRFSAGYRVPKQRLVAREPLAVIDMELASPFKRIFFPHHFYMAYAERDPSKLMMMWGGDPDENLQAFRTD